MKRSRASLMLFVATLVFALHAVRPASEPRAATAEPATPLTRLCTADWSPLIDCRTGAPSSHTVLAANNVIVVNSTAQDACHPEALPCSYQSHADYVHGVDCLGSAAAVHCSHEYEDAPPIEEFVYGDPSARSADAVAAQPMAEDYDMCADEFDCGIVVAPKIFREDITAITNNQAHSAGLQTALDINAKNDGIGEDSLATIRETVSPAIASNADAAEVEALDADYVGCDYDAGAEAGCRYRDCDYGDYDNSYCEHDYGCHADAEANASELDVAASQDLCGAGHCAANAATNLKVVTSGDEPLDLPPGESFDDFNADDDSYGYDYADDYDYDYDYDYQDDYSADSSSTGAEEYSSGDDYGYGYNDEELYVYEGDAGEPADLPPAEQLVDDLPPGEQLTDDLPPGEALPARDVAYDPYDVECYGDYADNRPAAPKAWIEPGCDEQESFCGKGCYPSDNAAELTDDQRSWGVGREYPAPPAFGHSAESQEMLRSTARLLSTMGEALLKLSRSLGELAGNEVDDQPAVALPAEALYPWPATLGRHQEIDAPLGL